MKLFFLFAFIFFSINCSAQNDGILFEKLNGWEATLEKAKAQNKYIFVDAYTTWCLPCKFMSEKIFTQEKVGTFFNKTFVNVAIQMDTTDHDNDVVKSWYKDAVQIAAKYKIASYPTYLFFNPQGDLVHVLVGAGYNADAFINRAANALDPMKQYETLKRRYDDGERDTSFLHALAQAAIDADDVNSSQKYINTFLALQTNLLTPENLALIARGTKHSSDVGFKILLDYPEAAAAFIGKEDRKYLVNKIAFDEDIFPVIMPQGKITEHASGMTVYGGGKMNKDVDWPVMEQKIKMRYRDVSGFIILNGKLKYFLWMGEWKKYNRLLEKYVFGKSGVDTGYIDMMANKLMFECQSKKPLKNATYWASVLGGDVSNPYYIETFSKLLYLAGEKNKAIAYMEKFRSRLKAPDDSVYETLRKMKNGEKIE